MQSRRRSNVSCSECGRGCSLFTVGAAGTNRRCLIHIRRALCGTHRRPAPFPLISSSNFVTDRCEIRCLIILKGGFEIVAALPELTKRHIVENKLIHKYTAPHYTQCNTHSVHQILGNNERLQTYLFMMLGYLI